MPTIILKKTFKIKPSGFKVAAEKSFSLHGTAVTQQVASALNQALAAVRYANGARLVQFSVNGSGHFYAQMNHDTQSLLHVSRAFHVP